MPLGDVSYQNAGLDDLVAGWPATGAVYTYWFSDPQAEDTPSNVEIDITAAGLSNASFDPSDWATATDGGKTTTAAVSLGTATSDLDDVIRYWGIVDSTGLIVYSDALDDPIGVSSGDTPTFSPQLSFGVAA